MTAAVLELTVRGTVAFLLVAGLDALVARRMSTRGRRYWWIAVAAAFLCVVRAPVGPKWPAVAEVPALRMEASMEALAGQPAGFVSHPGVTASLSVIWLMGALVSLGILAGQTLAASRRWVGARFCTDAGLLTLLEDCKREAGVTAPIGLVLSDRTATPAILGWLRPRILLPEGKARELTGEQLRHVFLHELVHFRAMDVPVGWLFALARCVHWFNPCAYLAERAWGRFREEATDERILRWVPGASYGETLVALVPVVAEPRLIPGALALSESFPNLKHRIQMIMNNHLRKSHLFVTLTVLAVLGLIAGAQPSRAEGDEKAAAVAATEAWLKGIDAGNYAQSWTEAAGSFQKAVTQEQWVQALDGVRKPLGKLIERKLASAALQTVTPQSAGKTPQGDYVIAQFETSFENMKFALETVTFEKEGGTWKAAGYFIKPKM